MDPKARKGMLYEMAADIARQLIQVQADYEMAEDQTYLDEWDREVLAKAYQRLAADLEKTVGPDGARVQLTFARMLLTRAAMVIPEGGSS